METFHRINKFNFKLLDPVFGIIGFFLVAVCVIWSLFYFDYSVVTSRILWVKIEVSNSSSSSSYRVEFLNGECDAFDGDWVFDETYPLYESRDCLFMDGWFRCSENGRPDSFYTKWRWQPRNCDLPRFDAKVMLEKLRNKRVVFVGDSIGRNQWESLLCMLSAAVPNKDSIYEVNGSPITKHKGFLVFKFSDYNCTVEYYRAPFLVLQSRAPENSLPEVKTTIKLDQMDWSSTKWRDADILVFNSGHWWNTDKTIRGGCDFQEGGEVKMGMEVDTAYRKSIETVMDWINREVNANKTQVFFRTYAPVHFRGGDWKNGGSCHKETLPEIGSTLVPTDTWSKYNIFLDVISTKVTKQLNVLNVTVMTSRRKDGHLSLYYRGPDQGPAPLHRQDCSHWCLPGVPDAWNELLYAFLLKQEVLQTRNSSIL